MGRRIQPRRRDIRRQSETVQADDIPTPASASEVERLLAEGRIVACQELPWGSNYSFVLGLTAVGAEEVTASNTTLAIYKPRRGEAPLWDFPDGTLYRREYAAYLTSQALGWGFIPPTVIRDGPYGVGTVQVYVEPSDSEQRPDDFRAYEHELMQVSLFDSLTNNADRKPGHVFVGTDGRLWGIDHGLTFHQAPKLRTVIWDFCGLHIPPGLLAALGSLLDPAQEAHGLWARLDRLISRVEVQACQSRLRRAIVGS